MALDLIEREGLEAFSLRALARALEVEPMSLYYWYPSRDDLLNAALERIIVALEVPTEGDWRDALRGAAWSFRRLALRYPAFFLFVARHRFNTPNALGRLEALLARIAESGLDPATRARVFRSWAHFCVGALLDEAAGYARGPGSPAPPAPEDLAERFPHVVALGPFNQPSHHEANFAFGLEALLAAYGALR